MTYRATQHGAAVTEVPISFVDRAAGESKMSSFIVLEALALVTWWGLGRIAYGARRAATGGRRTKAPPVGAGSAAARAHASTDTEDPVRSV
jgi:dolichol-phosphate mannosyltransferase